jgi:hypothetical protein
MNDLRAVLAKYSVRSASLGGSETSTGQLGQTDEVRSDCLRRDLKAVSEKNRFVFLICVAMVIVLFVGACWLVIKHQEDTTFIQRVLTVTGISFAGLIAQMIRLWKAKVLSDMTLVLASNLNSTDMRSVLEILLKSF